jgi:hypothetical protein
MVWCCWVNLEIYFVKSSNLNTFLDCLISGFYISLHISANGTSETDKGHERILETINTVGHDGNNIDNADFCLCYLKV